MEIAYFNNEAELISVYAFATMITRIQKSPVVVTSAKFITKLYRIISHTLLFVNIAVIQNMILGIIKYTFRPYFKIIEIFVYNLLSVEIQNSRCLMNDNINYYSDIFIF